MKKIFNLFFMVMIMFLVACNEEPIEPVDVTLTSKDHYTYYIGDEIYDYKLDVVAVTSNDEDLTNFVVVDDLGVNYHLEGSYTIYFTLNYEGKHYQTSASIDVLIREVEVTVIFEVPTSFSYTIGEDLPNYLEGITAKYSNGESLLDDVFIDDSLVDYEYVGTYEITIEIVTLPDVEKLTSYVVVQEPQAENEIDFNIFYLNDFHGAVLNDGGGQMGLAYIGNLIIDEKLNNNDTTLFITGGDMLQGQLISNYYHGANIIEMFNDMELDAFVVGNHEFDWGIDKVTQYFDGTHNIQANYPLLGANVYDKATNQLADGFEPYTIVEKSGVKFAIIGLMGYGLESSIAYARVKDYEFIDPVERTSYYAKKARVEDGADIIIAVNHHQSDYYNKAVANFKGDEKVDMIFNAHTHRQYIDNINGTPIMQSGANGQFVGKVNISYHMQDGILDISMENLNTYYEPRLNTPNPMLASKIDGFYESICHLYEPIMVSNQNADRVTLAAYIGKLMQAKFGADIGLHNIGGTRANIFQYEELSYAKLHAISPFDNSVVLVDVKGYELLNIVGDENPQFKAGLSWLNFDENATYTLATNDYMFGAIELLRNKEDAIFTQVSVLDLFVETVTNQSEVYDRWTIHLPLMFNEPNLTFTYLIPELHRLYL